MRMLKARFRDGDAFLASYDLSFAHGGVFVPTRAEFDVGTPVISAVQIGTRQSPLLLRGQIAWRRPGKHSLKIRAGVAVEWLAGERRKRDYLLSLARGTAPAPGERRHLRLPTDLPVLWRSIGALEDVPGMVRDIGRGGAFIETETPLPRTGGDEAEVVLHVAAPGAEAPQQLSARVAWVAAGHEDAASGFGVAWRARDAGGNRRIRELVRRVESTLHHR